MPKTPPVLSGWEGKRYRGMKGEAKMTHSWCQLGPLMRRRRRKLGFGLVDHSATMPIRVTTDLSAIGQEGARPKNDWIRETISLSRQ